MTINTAIQKRLTELCSNRGITFNKLADISGITQSTINNIMSGRNNSTTILTIARICEGLDMKIKDFFDSDVFDTLEIEIK